MIEPDTAMPCPKCGRADTWMRYCDSCKHRMPNSDDCRHGDAEHFHRGCRTCSYTWRTDDVIDPKVVCSE